MLPLIAKNLSVEVLTEGKPWDFCPDEETLRAMQALKKPDRRAKMLHPKTDWQVYSFVQGLNPSLRVSKENPAVAILGLSVDYDTIFEDKAAVNLAANQPENVRPNFIEKSLSGKNRLVWLFERPVLCPSPAFAARFMETLITKMGLKTLLPGYDPASERPAEVWTNGGRWYEISQRPLSAQYLFGIAADVAKRSSEFSRGEVPLEIIAEEINKRWPNRWRGEFKENAIGVRFWDERADNPTGCQVKPDGLICFTGPVPFVSWVDLFGSPWVSEQRAQNLGKAGEGLFFDGITYWENVVGKWVNSPRSDVVLRLKGRGLSDKTPKGVIMSDAERVLDHIQQTARVEAAAPLINYPAGIVDVTGKRFLNTYTTRPIQATAASEGKPENFPFIEQFLNGFFARPEAQPREHLEAWMARFYYAQLNYQKLHGQAVFICGPANNGKTLFTVRILAPLVGGQFSNPTAYFFGMTDFSSSLLEVPLMVINDESPGKSDAERTKFAQRTKGVVVNPHQTYHPKFGKKIEIEWVGRLAVTLNDDVMSVGMLPEVNEATQDKMSFYASQNYKGAWPKDVEARLKKELPYYAAYLLNRWENQLFPENVLSDDRCGVSSFYDSVILETSHQSIYSFNLVELIRLWAKVTWADEVKEWIGSPTDLVAEISIHDNLKQLAREWTVQKVSRSLIAAARQKVPGIEFYEGQRIFKITKI